MKTVGGKKKTVFKNILKRIGIIIAVIIVAGLLYERLAEFVDSKTLQPPGKMVPVSDHKLHIYCTGENKNGNPTVVLISGGGQTYSTWAKVQPVLSKNAKVCSYDRSGLGFSESTSDKRTNDDVTRELHELLINADVKPPYILVGHSVGGFYARVYTSKYPNEVNGLVLVDSSLDAQEKFDSETIPTSVTVLNKVMESIFYVGVPRLVLSINPESFGVARGDNIGRAFHSKPLAKQYRNKYDEGGAYDLLGAAKNFGSLPLRVLYADQSAKQMNPYLDNQAEKYQSDQAQMSTNSKAIRVENSSHFIQIDQPDIVVNSITEMLK